MYFQLLLHLLHFVLHVDLIVLFSAVTVSGFGIVSITNAIGGSEERSLLRVATRHHSLQGRSLLESVVAVERVV